MNLDSPGRLVDLWFRGWPYDHELAEARPGEQQELSDDFARELRAAIRQDDQLTTDDPRPPP